MNSYDVLDIPCDADDSAVRSAYLELIKIYSPEQFPKQFKQVSEAYYTLKNEDQRLQYDLFNRNTGIGSPFEVLLDGFTLRKRTPVKFGAMQRYLRQCAKK